MLVLLAAVATGAMAQTTYKVSVKEGTVDATNWTIAPAEATTAGVAAGTTVTATYSGTKKVKSVKAKKNGKFSVSDTKQVYFSKGNLQYDGTNWKFAASQWEVLGANGTGSNGTANNYPMDLFTWGNIDSPTYNGNTYNTVNADLSGITDWGSRMGSGWYTLSSAEWTYLFNTRTVNGGTGSGKSYTLGQKVNNKPGVVIYPDNYTGEVYSGSDWATFESAGCVFLPIAGLRGVGGGANVSNVGTRGCYWSRTTYNDNHAYYVNFNTSEVSPQIFSNRGYGLSVRLVRDVPSN